MQLLWLLPVIVGLAAGMAVGLQTPLANILSQVLGPMESAFIIHLSGAIFAGIFLLFMRGGAMAQWRSAPWYALCGGIFGLVVISSIGYIVSRLGASGAVTLIVVGQLFIAVLMDHFGFFGTEVRAIDLQRIIGLVILLLGTWLVVK